MREVKKNKLDFYIIAKVKEMREKAGLSQATLAVELDVSATFVGQVEHPLHRAKYNLYHINKLAKIFKCSPRDFLPEEPLDVT